LREERHELSAGEELVGGGESGRGHRDAELEVAVFGDNRWWRGGGVEREGIRSGHDDDGGHCRPLRRSINA
jgi:hypothetical protein